MNEFDDLENTLAAELRRRSGDVLGTEGMAGRARQRARVVRRRRAMAVGAVTAVALAVAVPSALSLREVPRTTEQPAGPPTTSETESIEVPDPGPVTSSPDPSTTQPASPDASPDSSDRPPTTDETPPPASSSTELVLDGLAPGAAPSIGWFDGPVFHRTDGTTVHFPTMWTEVIALENGFIASKSGEVGWLDPAGDLTASFEGDGPVLSPDGALVAYYDRAAGSVIAGQSDGAGTGPGGRDVPGGQWLAPVGFLDDYRLVSNLSTDSGTPAGIRIDGFAPGADPAPETPPWDDLIRVSAVSPAAGLVTGPTVITDDERCWAVYEADADEPMWGTCTYGFIRFSPDGRYLVGTTVHPDSQAYPLAVVVDARTGEVVHTFTGRHIYEMAFEDDDHLLLGVALEDGDDRQATLLRCDLDGACEPTTPVVSEAYRYTLAQPRW